MKGYRELTVWNKAMGLAEQVYRLARQLPKEKQYRLTSQLLRAVASVPANIAEGYQRSTRRDYAHFVSIAHGSLAETETFIMLAIRANLLPPATAEPALALADEVGRMLYALRRKLTPKPCPLNPGPSSLTPRP